MKKKVYVVINCRVNQKTKESFTDIIHIFNDLDLAEEAANEYVKDSILDSLRNPHEGYAWIEAQSDSFGKYYKREELLEGRCYLGFAIDDNIVETYDIRIEEHELKED